MVNLIKRHLKRTSLQELTEDELYRAQRELQIAQTHMEYYTAMVEYNKARVARLQHQTTEEQNGPS